MQVLAEEGASLETLSALSCELLGPDAPAADLGLTIENKTEPPRTEEQSVARFREMGACLYGGGWLAWMSCCGFAP